MNEEQKRRQLALEIAIRISERATLAATIDDAAKAIVAVARKIDNWLLGKEQS